MLEGISGISATKATALLEAFGTLRAVAEADREELQSVKGIGPEISRRIHAAFNSRFRRSGDEVPDGPSHERSFPLTEP